MKKQPTATATVKEMRALANKAEDAATRAENNLADTTLYSDAAREAATRSKVHAQNADDHAQRAELNAEDAASYATSAKYCLIATQIALAVVIIISLYSR